MKKIILLTVSLFIISVYSCKKDNNNGLFDEKDKAVSLLQKRYKFNDFDKVISSNEANSLLSQVSVNSTKNRTFNLDNVRAFKSKEYNTAIFVFQDNANKGESLAIKGYYSRDKFVIEKELNISLTISNDKEILIIANGTDKITLIDGVLSNDLDVNGIKANFTDSEGRHGGDGFCQKESGESFGDCYRAEKDEFCTDFFSCIAGDTVPAVAILIAAVCSCQATRHVAQ